MNSTFKLAILIDSEKIFVWQLQVLEKLVNAQFAEIKFILLKNADNQTEKKPAFSYLYILHEQIDKLIFSNSIEFSQKVDVLERFREISIIKSLTGNLIESVAFNSSEDNYHPDLILNFSNSTITDELLKLSKLGVLTYYISNQSVCRFCPTCYWEVAKELPEIEVCLQITQKNKEEKSVIYHSGILPYPNSINKNRNNAFMLASLLVPRIIKQISDGGETYLNYLIVKGRKSANLNLIDRSDEQTLTSAKALLNLLFIFYSFLRKRLVYHKTGRWSVMFKLNESNDFLPPDLRSLKILPSPRDVFWADPFVVSNDGFHYVFVEEFEYRKDKAHISVIKLDKKGDAISCETIIDKPYHMSYPHVFLYNDAYYLVPETGANMTIELYKCTDFPGKWVFVKNIMENIHAKDSTLFFHNNKWWLFVSIIGSSNESMSFNELFLFYADDLMSETWQIHPKNPIVSDHKLSRPAGSIYMRDNKIYRPSQDCSGIYGRAVNINLITKLTETEYEEVLISKSEPAWHKHVKGIHTFNFNEKIILMDSFTFRRRIF